MGFLFVSFGLCQIWGMMTHCCHCSTTFFVMNTLGDATININNEHFKLLVYDEFPTCIDDMATRFEVVGPYCKSISTTDAPMQMQRWYGSCFFNWIKTKNLNPLTTSCPCFSSLWWMMAMKLQELCRWWGAWYDILSPKLIA